MKSETPAFIIGLVLVFAFFIYTLFNWIHTDHWMVTAYLTLIYLGNVFWSVANHIEKYYR